MAKDAKGHGSDARGAHAGGVEQIGKPTPPIDRAKLNKTYNRNENNNFHSENVALLAKNFGTADEQAKAQEIVAARNKQGSLPTSTQNVPDVRNWQYAVHQKYIGQLTGNDPAPSGKSFHLNSYTHEIVSPSGEVAARMSLGKGNGVALDQGNGIQRNSGTALHDAVSMPDYRATKAGSNSFPAEHIGGELHYMTGNDFAGHTVRRVKG